MPTLLLRFPAGRYHATPFGQHVNEGAVEWPPSPWRLLRALLATGYATQHWPEPPPEARALVDALAATLPLYRLPPATVAHSRHYMPIGKLDKGREATTLVFDTWAQVGSGIMAVRWPCTLDPTASRLFGVLASHLGYLGRSESWVLGEALPDDAALPPGTDAIPHGDGYEGERGYEQVSLLAPVPSPAYALWREATLAQELTKLPTAKGAAARKARTRVEAPYPPDVFECLQKDTAWWRAQRWGQPPGSRRVLYWRSSDALSVGTMSAPARPSPMPAGAMLLAIRTPSGRTTALPTIARTLPQAELMHRALVSRGAKGKRVDCPELTGKDASGRPLAGHQHAHVLPVDLDADGHLDHVLIHAPMSLGEQAQAAIRGQWRTWMKGGVGQLSVALAAAGELDDLRRLAEPYGSAVTRLLGPPSGALTWKSVTPFVPPRHLKARGRNTLEGQVLAEIETRGLPGARVELLPWRDAGHGIRHAVRVRRSRPPAADIGFTLRLTFERPVRGPICLGYASHFGLGLFATEP